MIVNMYIIYVAHVKNSWEARMPMTYLQFKVGLCEALLDGWKMRNFIPEDVGAPSDYWMPSHSII
jgi:hypothetical protein